MYCDKLTESVNVSGSEPVAVTPKGRIAGMKKQSTYIFRGIRYAKAQRFQMPEETEAWSDIKAAVTYGYVCPELMTPITWDADVTPHYYLPQDEDCHFLNIWTQSLDKNARKPVMIWGHGGGWSSGSGVEQFAYDGEELSKYGDVVVVSFNHRLNCLGGLDLSAYDPAYKMSAYCGLGDVIMLLKWVKDNIAAFGGDPENVMVFGQSGGAAKILYAMQCPEADGLFHKAAIASGGIKEQEVPAGWTKRKLAQCMAELIMEQLGLSKENFRKIETVPYWDLAEAAMAAEKQLRHVSGLKGSYRWEPIEDGDYVVGSTLRDGFRLETKGIPMLIGNVFGESRSNILPQNRMGHTGKNQWTSEETAKYCHDRWGTAADAILTEFKRTYPENNPADVLFMDYEERDGMLGLARARTEMGADVWNWLFKKESTLFDGTVAWHCAEIPYIFHNTSYIEAAYEPGVSEKIEEAMCSAWVHMARTGNPNRMGKSATVWNKMNKKNTPTMIFDTVCTERMNHDESIRKILRENA